MIFGDVMGQYLQAQGLAPLGDWHPPLMALFWRLEITLFHTANLLNLTWISLSTLGLYLFLRLRPCLFSLLLFLLIFLSPVFFATNAFLNKDVPLSWLLLISSALLFTLPEKNDSNWKWVDKCLISFLLILCCLLRVNGAFIAVPLLIATWWSWKFDFKHLSACLALVILSLPATGWINHHIFKAAKEHPEVSLQLFDLAGIAFYSSHKHYDPDEENALWTYKNVFDNWKTAPLSEKLTACYFPKKSDTLVAWQLKKYPYRYLGWNKWTFFWNQDKSASLAESYGWHCSQLGQMLQNQDQKYLTSEWQKAIIKRPLIYLKHRFSYFSAAFLGHIDEGETLEMPFPWGYGAYYPVGEKDKIYGTAEYKNIIAHQYLIFAKKHFHLWSSYSIFWLASILALFIATFGGDGEKNKFANLLSFSALCYFAGYLFVGVGNDWRYIMPSAVLTIAYCLAGYVSQEKMLGSPIYQKVGAALWLVLMFWSCVI